jgi:signal transduction histidine kinase
MRLSFRHWLTLLNLALVAFVVAALLPAVRSVLERLADENARRRVELAAATAVRGVQQFAEEAGTSVRVLSQRPTLLRLVQQGEVRELEDFLERFRSAGALDGCAVFHGNELFAAAPRTVPWASIARDGSEPEVFGRVAGEEALLAIVAQRVPGSVEATAVAVRRLDAALERELSASAGLPVKLRVGQPQGGGVAGVEAGAYRAVLPLGSSGSASMIQVETSLSVEEANRSSERLMGRFVLVAALAGLLALAIGIGAGRYLARPIHLLDKAARRIAEGDLVSPVGPVSGVETGALASTMEIMRSRLRSATVELRHREAEAQALLASILEGVLAVDAERRIQYLNPQAAALLGVDASQAIGRFCGDVLHPAEQAGRRPCDEDCPIIHARARGSARAVEHLELPSGRRTVVVASAPPVGSRQVQILRDETEVEAARRQRDAVLANVSHELKTPVAAQLALIEMLRDGLGTELSRDAQDMVASLERSTLRLLRLVDNLLESVRIETGKATLRRSSVELEAVVDEAAALVLPLLEQSGQRLLVELPPGLPAVDGDFGQLTQVFVNLLANSHKFAPDGSAISVGGRREGADVSLWVEDAGPGIPSSQSASIFDQFHRAAPGSKGMGLGLWIVKSIVERHGGSVHASPAAGGGARFTVNLPEGTVE